MTPLTSMSVQLRSGSGGTSSIGPPLRPRLYRVPRSMTPALAMKASRRFHLAQAALRRAAWDSYEETSHWTNMAVSPVGSSWEAMAWPSLERLPETTTLYPLG